MTEPASLWYDHTLGQFHCSLRYETELQRRNCDLLIEQFQKTRDVRLIKERFSKAPPTQTNENYSFEFSRSHVARAFFSHISSQQFAKKLSERCVFEDAELALNVLAKTDDYFTYVFVLRELPTKEGPVPSQGYCRLYCPDMTTEDLTKPIPKSLRSRSKHVFPGEEHFSEAIVPSIVDHLLPNGKDDFFPADFFKGWAKPVIIYATNAPSLLGWSENDRWSRVDWIHTMYKRFEPLEGVPFHYMDTTR